MKIVSAEWDRRSTWHTGYRRVALARVTDPIKGTARDQVILVYHDTGWVCPNVIYRRDHDVMLFATRTGRGYAAIWLRTGAMEIRGGTVRHELFPNDISYDDLRTQVVRLLGNRGKG